MITKITDEVIEQLYYGKTLIHTNEHFKATYDFSKEDRCFVEIKTMVFKNGLYNESIADVYELYELYELKDTLSNMVTGGNYGGTLEWEK